MRCPLVSVITPVYNCDRFLAEAIDSVMAQSFETWELIIVDDGSTDNTPAVIAEYQRREPRIRLIRHARNRGLPAARNILTLSVDAAEGRARR